MDPSYLSANRFLTLPIYRPILGVILTDKPLLNQ